MDLGLMKGSILFMFLFGTRRLYAFWNPAIQTLQVKWNQECCKWPEAAYAFFQYAFCSAFCSALRGCIFCSLSYSAEKLLEGKCLLSQVEDEVKSSESGTLTQIVFALRIGGTFLVERTSFCIDTIQGLTTTFWATRMHYNILYCIQTKCTDVSNYVCLGFCEVFE